MRLDKQQSRERWRQIRALWNDFDPIGVMGLNGWPGDEYEAYLGPTLRLLEQRAFADELHRYLAMVTLEHMGLSESPKFEMARRQFAKRLFDWYGTNRPSTRV